MGKDNERIYLMEGTEKEGFGWEYVEVEELWVGMDGYAWAGGEVYGKCH